MSIATTSNASFYVTNCTTTNTTSTVSTGGTGNAGWIINDAPPQQAQALRIAQKQPIQALSFIGGMDQLPADFQQKVVEIPAHRIAMGLNWHDVKPNTVLELPDGTIIDVEDRHNYTIHDANTQISREHCTIRAFNRFINASEMLEGFIKDMAPVGIRQDQILKVPVEAFINWLIFKAAESDGDVLPASHYNHRCIYCKQFLLRKLVVMGVNFCSPDHLDRYLNKIQLIENKAKLLEHTS